MDLTLLGAFARSPIRMPCLVEDQPATFARRAERSALIGHLLAPRHGNKRPPLFKHLALRGRDAAIDDLPAQARFFEGKTAGLDHRQVVLRSTDRRDGRLGRIGAGLEKIPRQKAISQRIPHTQEHHVLIFKSHGENPAQLRLHVGLGVGVGFIDEQVSHTGHAEVGFHALVIQKRRSLQNRGTTLLQVAVEGLRRQRAPRKPRSHHVKITTRKAIHPTRLGSGFQKLLHLQKVTPHTLPDPLLKDWTRIGSDIEGHQHHESHRKPALQDSPPHFFQQHPCGHGHCANQADRASDLIEIKRRTDVSINRQELEKAEPRQKQVNERKSHRRPPPWHRFLRHQPKDHPHLHEQQKPSHRRGKVRRPHRHPQKLEVPAHHAPGAEGKPERPHRKSQEQPRCATRCPAVQDTSPQGHREQGATGPTKICPSVQSGRRESRVHPLSKHSSAVQPAQGAFGAERALPPLEGSEFKHGHQARLAQCGKVRQHRKHKHNSRCQSPDAPSGALRPRTGKMLHRCKHPERRQRHETGFPIRQRQQGKTNAENQCRPRRSPAHKAQERPKNPRQDGQRDDHHKMLKPHRPREHRGVQQKQHRADPSRQLARIPAPQKKIHPCRASQEAAAHRDFRTRQETKRKRGSQHDRI